ncbi:hypothetical protein VPHK392_0013 [Vibrio phage K392]
MLTWKQFKEHVEANGANDDTEIDWIDIHLPYDTDNVDVHVNCDNELTIDN